MSVLERFQDGVPPPTASPRRQSSDETKPATDAGGTDAELIANGGVPGFGMLYDRYGEELYWYCARRVGAQLAEDLTAEVFLIAFERRDRYEPSRQFARPWLYGIATNLIRQHRRAESAHYRALGRLALDPLTAAVDGPAQGVAERVDAAAVSRKLAKVLAAMPTRQRDVLLLFAVGLEYSEIAAVLDIPQGTVQSRLHRARLKLRGVVEMSQPDVWGGSK